MRLYSSHPTTSYAYIKRVALQSESYKTLCESHRDANLVYIYKLYISAQAHARAYCRKRPDIFGAAPTPLKGVGEEAAAEVADHLATSGYRLLGKQDLGATATC